MNLEDRVSSLEKRISALENQLKSGKENAEIAVSCWESVVLEFADKFGLGAKEVRDQIARRRGWK